MKAIMVMYDSLSKSYLSPYGSASVRTPNFERLAKRAMRFDNFFVGSMPCMPARRELHTGRYNFLHRGWGPVEPFDDSMPQLLREHGTYTHLVTDHYHYLEDGGCTYHNRYSSWEVFRGQEGDYWKGEVGDPDIPLCENYQKAQDMPRLWRQDWINRKYLTCDKEMPQSRTFAAGLEFIETNKDSDNWFLQIETFDPHEPFFAQKEYRDMYPHAYSGKHFDWPSYGPVRESEELVNHIRAEYSALVSMCDAKLGLVLDVMDEHNLWKDTMLIVCTDHGFLLGEHNWWAKNIAPLYNEVANTPFFLYDPRYKTAGVCDKLAQTIDIPATLLEFFGADIPKDMQGKVLGKAYAENEVIHEQILYGYFGGTLNTSDGRFTYLRAPEKSVDFYEYTLMPANMNNMFSVDKLKGAELSEGFGFTKGAKVLQFKVSNPSSLCLAKNLLFDTMEDPGQTHNIDDRETETRLINGMLTLLKSSEAPKEQYERFDLPEEGEFSLSMLQDQRMEREKSMSGGIYDKYRWTPEAKELYYTISTLFRPQQSEQLTESLDKYLSGNRDETFIEIRDITCFVERMTESMQEMKMVKKVLATLIAYARA
ncbi:sulfatase [Anaerocolumna xylanovorans]|uniref:Arylsulfatase A n=1 Tax=Anaerocolumna xylanovorans DSM 12503 TaxID=1121345 RepID=A0A1M7Y719_9FIRM|nr:sulfatase [Anaerocolumna xylanovorans]SHO48404.1 Arylsulfatase A [Anaerocolumna xylanovorans DSM 12503]